VNLEGRERKQSWLEVLSQHLSGGIADLLD